MTHNELEKADSLSNYYIYFVFSATSKTPKILPIKYSEIKRADYSFQPVTYHVTLLSHLTTEFETA